MKKLIPIGSHRLCIQDNGLDRQDMVFIHGLPTSKELFLPLTELFKNEYRTIAIDLLDYGESDKPGRHMAHRERAFRLCELFSQLQLNHIILVCHDLGSSVIIDLMALCPENVEQLIIMSPPVFPDFKEPPVVKFIRTPLLGEVLVSMFGKRLLKKALEKGLIHKDNYELYLKNALEKSFSGRAGRQALLRNLRWGRPSKVFLHYPDIMKTITQPVLILQGLQDPYIPVSHAARLQEKIKGAELVVLENAGHFLPIDVPVRLHESIVLFLKRLA